MLSGYYSAASGLQAIERMHGVIAENLAHVSVPGYRGSLLVNESFESAMQGALEHPSPAGHGAMASEVATDFSTGPTAQTMRKLDVTISGDGFFELAGPQGPLFTRNGVFQINGDRQLVTSDGMLVQGTTGSITLPAESSTEAVNIAQDGNITVNVDGDEVNLGQLRIVQFADNQKLQRAGTTLFSAPPGVVPQAAQGVTVLQGVRELSNISAVNEMVRMIWCTRQYEAAQKALSTLDEAIGQRTNPQT